MRSTIQLGDWNWFRSRWQDMDYAIALGVKEEIGDVMFHYLELWGSYLKTPDNRTLSRQLRWLTHILFHREDLLPDPNRRVAHVLALRGNDRPESFAELATVIDLFPETLLSLGPGGSFIADPEAQMLAQVGKRALSCPQDGQTNPPIRRSPDFFHALSCQPDGSRMAADSVQHWNAKPDHCNVSPAIRGQRAQGKKVGLWFLLTVTSETVSLGGAERQAVVRRCTALQNALSGSIDLVPILCDFVLETRDREAIASLLSDRGVVRDTEAMEPRFLNAWKGLPSRGDGVRDAQRTRPIEEQYNRRGLRP